MHGESAPADISIVHKAFLVLGAFRSDPVLGVSELSRRTGIPRTTVHRIARQLLDEGALSRVGSKFRIGATLFELGNLHFPRKLIQILQPLLDDLQRLTGADVSLLELVGDDVLVTVASRSRKSTSPIANVGRRLPAHCCAGGQVLLAETRSEPPVALAAVTSKTIVDQRSMRRRLASVRHEGVAVEHGEAEEGCTTIAIPVQNRHGRVLGSMMLSGPSTTVDVELATNALLAFGPTFTLAGQRAAIGFFASARPRSLADPYGSVSDSGPVSNIGSTKSDSVSNSVPRRSRG
jgi:DNA-binding IclR family transcriptional regulator